MGFLKRNIGVVAGIVFGMLAGFLYWNYVGCVSGTCAITSNPVNSTFYGALIGGLLGSIFKKKDEKKEVEG